ncbi:MAG: hypothetical protein ACT4TC_18750 [Myxococcaceae bacterium]
MKSEWMLVPIFAGVLLITAACANHVGWRSDESLRIDKAMQTEPLPEAPGVAVVYAPPVADPPKPSETFRLQDRRQSLGRVRGSQRLKDR